MRGISDTVKHLIIINVLFFVASKFIGTKAFDLLAVWFPENERFHFWQVITHMFMHHPTFYLHILFNMLALWMFGTPLEQMWGRNKFIFFYFSCGIGALLLPMAIDYYHFYTNSSVLIENGFTMQQIIDALNEGKVYNVWESILGEENQESLVRSFSASSLGASGAIMGLLLAFGLTFPNTPLMLIFLPIPIKAKYFIPILLGYEFISGFIGGASIFGVTVGHWAHIGGAAVGFVIAYYWKKNSFNNTRWN